MLNKLKLKNRIYSGFIVGGLIAASMAVISVAGFYYANNNFKHFVEFSKDSQLVLSIARDVLEIQRQALIYTYEGHQTAAGQVHDIYRRISGQLKRQNPEHSKHLQHIMSHLDTYVETFAQVQQQRKLQSDLVHVEIRNFASKAERYFRNYIDKTATDDLNQLNDQRILNSLLQVEKYAMRYFDSLDSSHVVSAKKAIAEVQRSLKELKRQTSKEDASDEISKTLHFVNEYEQIFLEAVQRTRGYLFLVNVVMSAEAYEIIYHSKEMEQKLAQEMEAIERDTLHLTQQVTVLIIGSSAVFLILIGFVSVVISHSITAPIERLTTTFIALAKGSHQAEIPAYQVKDEIGALTDAAIVFRLKNRETEALLSKSERLSQELERSNDELEQFVYTVSHDLKSPLVTSMGFIGIIQKLAAAGKMSQAIEKLDKVASSNHRMGQLINDLLELSRVGRVDLDKKPLDLNSLLKSLHDNHASRLEKAGIEMNIEAGLPTLHANESRILQLFENLLSNALKYATKPEGTVIDIGKRVTEDSNLVYFKDNGPGIAREYHEKIFGLFYRLDTQQEGTGIGLAVAAKVMKFHGGCIWVESELGNGTTFWLKFPKHNPNRQNNESTTEKTHHSVD